MALDIVKGEDGYIPLPCKKIGRPRRESDLLNRRVYVSMTEAEFEVIGKMSAEMGVSMSDILRRSFINTLKREK